MGETERENSTVSYVNTGSEEENKCDLETDKPKTRRISNREQLFQILFKLFEMQ
jgi:hypothetical protein